ncbi:MAG: hypothetical protein ACRCS9_12555 [Hyphomicrobium sp.]
MRIKSLLALMAGLMCLAAAPQPAASFHWDRPDQPRTWGHVKTVRHWVYTPRYRHVYLSHAATDRYAYRYEPRGYYPYYNSNYWRPAHRVRRAHHHLPPYYQAWGSPRRHYRHVEWHYRRYGGHRRGHW